LETHLLSDIHHGGRESVEDTANEFLVNCEAFVSVRKSPEFLPSRNPPSADILPQPCNLFVSVNTPPISCIITGTQ